MPNGGYVQALDTARDTRIVLDDCPTMTYRIGPTNTRCSCPNRRRKQSRYTVISVDDHLVEPPDMFDGRLPQALQERAPRLIENDNGHQVWQFEARRFSQVGLNAVAGRKPDPRNLEPSRFEDMRRGCWDVHARIADMDLCGIWASMNFPSQITGFCGRVFSAASDRRSRSRRHAGLERLAVRRMVSRRTPSGSSRWASPFLPTPNSERQEIRRNAARGFTSVTLPERPHAIGFPSLFKAGGTRSSRHVSRPAP